ncbi:hypothetical protein PCE1_004125 [Barthelona sp. PCE]
MSRSSKLETLLLACVLGLLCINMWVFVSRISFKKEMPQDIDANIQHLLKRKSLLPETWRLPKESITPVNDQHRRGTCYAFATFGALESAYALNGVRKGYLEVGESVKFSEQSYGMSLVEIGEKDPAKFPITRQPERFISDGYLVWLFAFEADLKKAILPTKVCPYYYFEDSDPEWGTGTLKCEGRDAALSTNPVEYDVKTIKSVYTKDELKEVLMQRESIIPFSTPLFGAGDYIRCDVPGWEEMCLIRNVSCPYQYGFGKRCYHMAGKSAQSDGAFFYEEDDSVAGIHVMGIAGWSDEFVIDPFMGGRMQKGHFILRNSWNASSGHSIQYLSGEISFWDELELCPMWSSPRNWIKCTRGAEHHEGFETIAGASYPWYWNATDMHPAMLKAKSVGNVTALGFNPDINYCVESAEKDSPKRFEVCFAETEDGSKKEGGETLCISSVNVDYLTRLVDRIDEYPLNDPDNCGYWSYPYEVFDASASSGAGFWFADLDIGFTKCSYAKNAHLSECHKFDYTLLRQSTHKMKYATFESPLPWEHFNT